MELLFLGAGSVIPEAGRDTASLLINGRHMIDTGWSGGRNLLANAIDPLAIETLIFTHFHHDHYLGLPEVLFLVGMKQAYASGKPRGLRILGPAEHLNQIVGISCSLLQWDRFPELPFPLELIPLQPGESRDLGELELSTIAAKHTSGKGYNEPALSVRMKEKTTGRTMVYSGDTSYNSELAAFARGADVLIHDGAHSKAREAAETARDGSVGRLYLVHYNRPEGPSKLEEARSMFGESHLGVDGEMLRL